jgi:SAM-dependent methyltransferase
MRAMDTPIAEYELRPAAVSRCLCGAPQSAFEFAYKKGGCDVAKCRFCGSGRASLPNGFDPQSYYSAAYFDGGHADGYADYAGSESVLRAEFSRTIRYLRKFVPAGRLLELGCAYGYFLKEASPFYETHGIEISADAVRRCHDEAQLNVRHGVLDDEMARSIGTFDVIVMLDVIEHLDDPADVVARCAQVLRPGGVVLLTTGDFSSAHARVAGSRWRLMTPPQHLWFLTRHCIEALAASVGPQAVAIDHPWKLVPLSLVEHQARRMLGAGTNGATILPSWLSVPINLFDAMRVVLRKQR